MFQAPAASHKWSQAHIMPFYGFLLFCVGRSFTGSSFSVYDLEQWMGRGGELVCSAAAAYNFDTRLG